MMAGPSTAWPGCRPDLANRSTSDQAPAVNMGTCASLTGRCGAASFIWTERSWVSALSFSWAPMTSTETASTMIVLSRIRNEKRRA